MAMNTINTAAKINQQTGMVMAYYGYDQSKTPQAELKAKLSADWAAFDSTNGVLIRDLGANYNLQKNTSGKIENSFSVYVNTDTKQIVISFKAKGVSFI